MLIKGMNKKQLIIISKGNYLGKNKKKEKNGRIKEIEKKQIEKREIEKGTTKKRDIEYKNKKKETEKKRQRK